MIFFNFLKKRHGSFLIEAMVALSLVIIGLLGLISLVNRSLSLNQNVQDRFIASALAAEGIEVVKNLIDGNIAKGGRGNWLSNISDGYYELTFNCDFLNVPPACAKLTPDPNISSLNSVFNNRADFLKLDSSTRRYNYLSGSITAFKRLVSVKVIDPTKEVRVNSFVRWQARGITSDINVEDHFYDWRQ